VKSCRNSVGGMNLKKLFFITVLVGTVIFVGIVGYSYFRLKSKTSHAYFETGKAFYDEGKYSEAAIEFSNALKRDVKDRNTRYFLALSYLGQENLTEGVRQLRLLLEFYPDDIPTNLKLGGIYMAAGSTNPEFYRQAKITVEKVLAQEPANVAALILTGNILAGLKDFTHSAELLEKAISLDPKSVSAYISLGSTQVQAKKQTEAEKAFLNAREVEPKNKSVLISLANFYRVSGSTDKALRVFKEALSLYPADRGVYFPAAGFYLAQHRFEDVENILKAAQASNRNDPTPTLDLADAYQFQNRVNEARKLLLDAKSTFPASIAVSLKLASNLMADKPEEARQEVDQILKADP
jgi:tetratricopeptide (TPR) repeat protein